MRVLVTVALTILLAAGPAAPTDFDKAKCAAVKEKIRNIQSRMRAGYTRAQGERMESQLRKLRKQRKSVCR